MRELAIRIKDISIHALREEGDADLPVDCHGSRDISIHALREEGDSLWLSSGKAQKRFLSTPSARRATPGQPLR